MKENDNVDYGTDACEVPKTSKRKNCPFLVGQKLRPEEISISVSLKMIIMSSFVLNLNNSIEYMDFSSNIFYQWRGQFFQFDKLKYLDLSNNFCSNVTSDFFKNIPHIKTLDISKNNLGLILAGTSKVVYSNH